MLVEGRQARPSLAASTDWQRGVHGGSCQGAPAAHGCADEGDCVVAVPACCWALVERAERVWCILQLTNRLAVRDVSPSTLPVAGAGRALSSCGLMSVGCNPLLCQRRLLCRDVPCAPAIFWRHLPPSACANCLVWKAKAVCSAQRLHTHPCLTQTWQALHMLERETPQVGSQRCFVVRRAVNSVGTPNCKQGSGCQQEQLQHRVKRGINGGSRLRQAQEAREIACKCIDWHCCCGQTFRTAAAHQAAQHNHGRYDAAQELSAAQSTKPACSSRSACFLAVEG